MSTECQSGMKEDLAELLSLVVLGDDEQHSPSVTP